MQFILYLNLVIKNNGLREQTMFYRQKRFDALSMQHKKAFFQSIYCLKNV